MAAGSNSVAQVVLEILVPTAGVAPVLTISCASPPAGIVGTFYSHLFPATGDTPPDVFTISAGALPTGLVLDPGTGIVSGVPTIPGTFPFTIQVTDSTLASANAVCSITITAAQTLFAVRITLRGVNRFQKCDADEQLEEVPEAPHVKRAI